MNKREKDLLLALQSGLPIVSRPFARIGEKIGLTETDVLRLVREFFDQGVARRLGAVFDSRSLGYDSTLCAADIPERDLEATAARLAPHPGITHCYQRDGHPNLWFTLTAPAEELSRELARVAETIGPCDLLNLPALQKFKIEAVFGRSEDAGRPPGAGPRPARQAPAAPAVPLSERERQVVRLLQVTIPLVEDPFATVARELGYEPAALLALLSRWQQDGVIRRIGLIVRHYRLGFTANSMCVWLVPSDRIAAAGRAAAASPHVTHCYERPASASFPFNLYAMVHAKTREEAGRIFAQITTDAALPPGRMLWSVREFKKSSPVFFREQAAERGAAATPAPGTVATAGREAGET